MKGKIFISLFLLIILTYARVDRYKKGNLVIENIPTIPARISQKLELYQNVRAASFRDWLPYDNGILIATRFGEAYQLHIVEVPKGVRQQLTFFREPVSGGLVCPDFKKPYLLFTKDSAGNEVDQIFKFNLRTKEYKLLSDGKSRHLAVLWSNKGDKFSFSSNMRNNRDFDIYIGTLEGKKRFETVLQKEGYWYAVDWSPDDKKLLVKEYISASESYYYIIDIHKKDLIQVNPLEQKISYGSARWAKDGKGIYLVSDQFSDFKQLLYYDLGNKKSEILSKQIPWDVEDFELSPVADTIACISNEDGVSRLYFINAKTQEISQVRLPLGYIYNMKFKPDGEHLAFVLNTPKSQSDVYSLNLKNKTLIRWTYSELGGLDINNFIEPQLIHYETFDSIDGKPRMIPAFYYTPTKFKPPYPVLIDCHGGPTVQYTPTFSSMIQFFLDEMGIAVIGPNYRGSSGYGKEYLMLDDEYKREDAVRDIGALLDWIEKQPELDSRRIAVTGGSYGGYMSLASMVLYGDRLKCGIDEWGISNFVTFLENTGRYRVDLRRTEYGDERDPEMRKFLNEISPLTNAHKIKKPMFVVQGLNDPRVPVSEAEQIVEAVRKNGIDVWYLLAEDEGHGFGKKSNWDYYREALILFLEKYLLE
jgi:dipeptidyl aminopeptidase/acylaminoacyl peptidase